MLNVQASGRIASDVPLNKSQDGKHMYTNFLLASHDRRKETIFIRCVAFDGMATVLHEFYSQGDRIIINGTLIEDNYKNRKYSFKIKVMDCEFIETLAEHEKNKQRHPPKSKKKKEEKKYG